MGGEYEIVIFQLYNRIPVVFTEKDAFHIKFHIKIYLKKQEESLIKITFQANEMNVVVGWQTISSFKMQVDFFRSFQYAIRSDGGSVDGGSTIIS